MCDKDIDECTIPGLCKNGGTCDNKPGTYFCACKPEWIGKYCQLEYLRDLEAEEAAKEKQKMAFKFVEKTATTGDDVRNYNLIFFNETIVSF